MARFWTACWQNRYWRGDVNAEYENTCSSGSNLFRSRGIAVGDTAYIVSWQRGQLLLGGRMTVRQILTRAEAVQFRGSDTLYEATDWIIDDRHEGTPLNFHRQLAPALSRQLSFVSRRGEPKGLFFASENGLDRQAIRGVRELTPESAAFLDHVIAITDAMPRSDLMITVTNELLNGALDAGDVETLPGEALDPASRSEGALRRILVNRYERDPIARDKCIEHYGAACMICGFDFGANYGPLARGFIHVHHLKALSEIGRSYEVDPIMDLRPVCPNCHAVIHLGRGTRTIEEIEEMLSRTKKI